jgi:hypothetical protein
MMSSLARISAVIACEYRDTLGLDGFFGLFLCTFDDDDDDDERLLPAGPTEGKGTILFKLGEVIGALIFDI